MYFWVYTAVKALWRMHQEVKNNILLASLEDAVFSSCTKVHQDIRQTAVIYLHRTLSVELPQPVCYAIWDVYPGNILMNLEIKNNCKRVGRRRQMKWTSSTILFIAEQWHGIHCIRSSSRIQDELSAACMPEYIRCTQQIPESHSKSKSFYIKENRKCPSPPMSNRIRISNRPWLMVSLVYAICLK